MTSAAKVYRFSVFELDVCTGEFRKKRVRIRLQQQPLQVLIALLERPGELVTREELKRRLWPDDTFVDFDHSLNAAVNRLREVLDDSANTPRFVETLPRRGYRFIAPVAGEGVWPVVSPAEAGSAQPTGPTPSKAAIFRGGRSRFAGWAALAGTLVLGAILESRFLESSGSGLRLSLPNRVGVEEQRSPLGGDARVVPFTSFPGDEFDPAFSPDGREVVFAWTGPADDNLDIYVKQVGDEAMQRVTTQPGEDSSPAWSPDGRQIAFLQESAGSVSVMVISTRAGTARPIATFDGIVFVGEGPSFPYLTWAPDGRGVVVVGATAGPGPAALYYVSIETREKRQLTNPPTATRGDGSPAFSADGKTLAFVRQLGERDGVVYLLSVDREVRPLGEPRKVPSQMRAAGSVVWSAGGRELIYPSNEGGTALWRVSADGSAQPQRLTIGGGFDMDPTGWGELETAFSASAGRLIYQRINRNADVWRLRLSGPRGKVLEKSFVSNSTSSDCFPSLSPDGGKIAFNSNRGGTNEVWIVNTDGSDAEPLTSFGGPAGGAAAWSPDGTRLALHVSAGRGGDICTLETSGGPLACLTVDAADDQFPRWSRDSQWIYLASNRSGRSEIWKIRSSGENPTQLTRHGGFGPMESVDRKWVYYTNAAYYGSIWKVPVDGGPETEVVRSPLSYFKNFHVVSEGIYFVTKNHNLPESALLFFRFSDQKTVRLADVERLILGLDVSADERVIVWSQDADSTSDLVMVENFR